MAHAGNTDANLRSTTRRDFLKYSSLAALAAGSGGLTRAAKADGPAYAGGGRSNGLPGRIVLAHDPNMGGTEGSFDRDLIEQTVHSCVRMLTGEPDTGQAFEALFPDLHAGTTIAIKVNCIGSCDTRWETARGVVSGLSMMLGGTYDVSNVVVFDRHNLPYHGYETSEFTFGGNTALISSSNNASGSGYYPYGGYQLSQFFLDRDYVINMPVLKSHSDGNNQLTLALKNHYGSCSPSSLCGNIPGMLTLNADTMIKDKTALVLMDGIRGTWNGGPGNPPMEWDTFNGGAPNMLFVTTDPVTNEYWGRDVINAERAAQGYSLRPCTWIEGASEEPYYLGVSDEAAMDVLYYDASAIDDDSVLQVGGLLFAPPRPNPMIDHTTLRFRVPVEGRVSLVIADASGRIVRHLGERTVGAGYSQMHWDGRDDRGQRVARGAYFATLTTEREVRSRRIILG